MDARTQYREAAVRGARPVVLIVLLYEQMIEDLRQAINAIERDHIELRTNKINHAILVIANLKSSLNKQAGQVALNLERFYTQLRLNLVKAQFQASAAILSSRSMTSWPCGKPGWKWIASRRSPGVRAAPPRPQRMPRRWSVGGRIGAADVANHTAKLAQN